MTSSLLAELLLERSGKKVEDLANNNSISRLIRKGGVRPGPEFERILALPRRQSIDIEELVELLTNHLKTPNGTQRLRPHQAQALQELYDYGCVGEIPVGEGKTLVTFLAGTLLGAKRPLLLLKASLIEKTEREFKELRKHWRCPNPPKILSYEKLSREKQSDFLDRHQPDLILADEAQKLRNLKSGRVRRLKRYMKERPQTIFAPLSGTLSRKSLLEYSHLAEWALKNNSPVPKHYPEIDEWRRCLDPGIQEMERLAPGCLSVFGEDVQAVRDGYAKWRRDTLGWITVQTSGVASSLQLTGQRFDGYASHVDEIFYQLRENSSTPDGEYFAEPVKLWAYLRQCSMGFWYRLDPPPPQPWKDSNKAKGQFTRDILSQNKPHLDTEQQVELAVARGEIKDGGVFARWREIKPTYDRNKHRHTEWFDDSFVRWCHKWLKDTGGVLFTPYIAMGEKLREVTGLPYFSQGGCDPKFGSIETYEGGPCIASLASNLEGRNLQDRWSVGCLVGGSGNSLELQQLIGRFHRPGQEADEVEFVFPYGCVETVAALHKAKEEALAKSDPQHKLVVGDWCIDDVEDAETWPGPRWQKQN